MDTPTERHMGPVPHVRGDEPVEKLVQIMELSCSPRAWG